MSREPSKLVVYGRETDEQRRFWISALSQNLARSYLVPDYDLPDSEPAQMSVFDFELPGELSRMISDLTKDSPLLTYTALLSALVLVLHKTSGNRFVVVGSPPRSRGEDDTIPNALPIVTEVEEHLLVKEWLLKLRAHLLHAYDNQAYPYHRLLDHLDMRGTRTRCPLFDVVLVLRGFSGPMIPVNNDVTLFFSSGTGRLAGSIEFDCRRFALDSLERLERVLVSVSEQMFANTSKPIRDVQLLAGGERHQVLFEWNATRTDWCRASCIHQLFETQAGLTPNSVALACEDGFLTYSDLNQRANQLANYLIRLNVEAEVKIGICVETSMAMVIGLLGIIKAGGTYVPLDPSYPSDRLTFMINNADVKVLLTQSWLIDHFRYDTAEVVCLDSASALLAAEGDQNPDVALSEDNLLSIFYTSGTSGSPKGVMMTHHGIRNTLLWRQSICSVNPDDNVLQNFSFGFDPSLWQILTPIISGARVTMAKPGPQDTAYLVRVITEGNVTIVDFVPATLEQFLAAPDANACASLREVFCGGEALPLRLANLFRRHFGGELRNQYGPTETGIDSTSWRVEPGRSKTAPIGRPIANKQVYLLDRYLEPVPPGAPGEVYVGGAGLARGYLSCSDLTAESFVPDPFSSEIGNRMYRTGDASRHLSDGNLEFLGRRDGQVKIRGNRIELEEIEAVLRSHQGIDQAVVLAGEDSSGEKELTVYVIFSKKADITSADIRPLLEGRLPSYMIPSCVVALDALPLTPHGKLDRRALAALKADQMDTRRSFAAPRTPTEETLAAIWADILHQQQIGINDDFFERGGHSLLATQVISRAREALEVDLTVRDLFETRTVAQMAEAVQRRKAGNSAAAFRPIAAIPRGGKSLDELLKKLTPAVGK